MHRMLRIGILRIAGGGVGGTVLLSCRISVFR